MGGVTKAMGFSFKCSDVLSQQAMLDVLSQSLRQEVGISELLAISSLPTRRYGIVHQQTNRPMFTPPNTVTALDHATDAAENSESEQSDETNPSKVMRLPI